MSRCGNPSLERDKELEKALVRIKSQCPEEAELALGRLEAYALRLADDAAASGGEASGRYLGMYQLARTVAQLVRDADGLEPEPGEKPKYDRSIDQ